jgi:cobalt/nickel transport system permease protein
LHHAVIDRWSRQESVLHARDARAKVVVLLAFLVALGTTPRLTAPLAAAYLGLVIAAVAAARLPAAGVLLRASVVLPFAAAVGLASALSGHAARSADLVARSYISAAAALVLISTTPLPKLLDGLESLGAPRFLSLVGQFLYRYLFVISEQAQHMRLAALSRASQSSPRRLRFRAAAGALATLFARSHARAEGIHQAMLARGFTGRTAPTAPSRLRPADVLFLAAGVLAAAALRLLPLAVAR